MQTFTPQQVEILMHRLVLDDEIVEVFMDVGDDDPPCPWLPEELYAAIKSVVQRVTEDRWNDLTDAERAVLQEAYAGSTWCGTHSGCDTEAEQNRAVKAMERLADKLSSMLGVRIPAVTY